jgi:hypothetical protein
MTLLEDAAEQKGKGCTFPFCYEKISGMFLNLHRHV